MQLDAKSARIIVQVCAEVLPAVIRELAVVYNGANNRPKRKKRNKRTCLRSLWCRLTIGTNERQITRCSVYPHDVGESYAPRNNTGGRGWFPYPLSMPNNGQITLKIKKYESEVFIFIFVHLYWRCNYLRIVANKRPGKSIDCATNRLRVFYCCKCFCGKNYNQTE